MLELLCVIGMVSEDEDMEGDVHWAIFLLYIDFEDRILKIRSRKSRKN